MLHILQANTVTFFSKVPLHNNSIQTFSNFSSTAGVTSLKNTAVGNTKELGECIPDFLIFS
jgi:hypothetical protein